MSIHDVKRVMEIGQGDWHGVGGERWGVNEYLAEGWILLNVHSVSTDSDSGPTQNSEYVLGWTGDDEPPSDEQKRQDAQRGHEILKELRGGNDPHQP